MTAACQSYGIVINDRFQWLIRKDDALLSQEKREVKSDLFWIPRADHAPAYTLSIYTYRHGSDDSVPTIWKNGKHGKPFEIESLNSPNSSSRGRRCVFDKVRFLRSSRSGPAGWPYAWEPQILESAEHRSTEVHSPAFINNDRSQGAVRSEMCWGEQIQDIGEIRTHATNRIIRGVEIVIADRDKILLEVYSMKMMN